jgi:hypothetical protein
MTVVLPFKLIEPDSSSPNNLIIFSKPKTGKTELVSKLPNCLILDFEKGSRFVSALKVQIESVADLRAYGSEILKIYKETGKYPYDYIAVDTVTALEALALIHAETVFMRTPMGKNWLKKGEDGKLAADAGKRKYGNIIGMPDGAGYHYLRLAFDELLGFINTLAPRIILLGHIKDVNIDKEGVMFTAAELDLTGKLKRITTSDSDAVGYLYRKGKKNILSFKTKEEVACGARPKHLSNEEIVISELDENNNLITHWDKIYID